MHTDHGVEFKNGLVIKYLIDHNIKQSFGFRSKPTSNASIEAFLSTFKQNFNVDNKKFVNKKHLEKIVGEFVMEYNHVSPQKTLQWLSPISYKENISL